ncbi:hypothetical protein [Halogranum rubrum]|uniref:Uncharacterized protein n=1 Tax=Halogranum salarium B-1 TaxID=1210908 RepID=J3JED6_9EURY|nr:hypothetical protein [Halogranum salarium]EJN58269.1 hypothetical protein HSB1_36860 [Halogranum salarium B-1]
MPSHSRRDVLTHGLALSSLVGLSGCTALTAVESTIHVTNHEGPEREQATYWVVRDGVRSEPHAVELDPNELYEENHSMQLGDEVRFEKNAGNDTLSMSWQLDIPVCTTPVFDIDIGWGALSGGFHCE